MNQLPLDFRPRTERDKGIKRAVDHADAENPSWSDRALAFIHEYSLTHSAVVCESVRAYAESRGMPKPPTARAWGGPMVRARKLGWLQKTQERQVAADPGVHMNELHVWRSLIYQRQN